MDAAARKADRRIAWMVVAVTAFGSIYGLAFIWFSIALTSPQQRSVGIAASLVAVGLAAFGTLYHALAFRAAQRRLSALGPADQLDAERDATALLLVQRYPQVLAVRLAIMALVLLSGALAGAHRWFTPFNTSQIAGILAAGVFVTFTFAVIAYFRSRWILGPSVAALVERLGQFPRRGGAGITLHLWLFSLAVAVVPLIFVSFAFTNQSLRAIEVQLIDVRHERLQALATLIEKEGVQLDPTQFEDRVRRYVGATGTLLLTRPNGDVVYMSSPELFLDPATGKPKAKDARGVYRLANSDLPRAIVEELQRGDEPGRVDIVGQRMVVTHPLLLGKAEPQARLWYVFRREGGELRPAVQLAAILGVLVIGLVGTMIAIFGQTLRGPLREIEIASQRIAKGDLTRHVRVTTDDEIGLVALSFRHMHENLLRLLGRVSEAAQNVGDVASQLVDRAHGIEEASRTQVRSVEDTAASIAQMSSSVTGILESIEELKLSAGETSASIEQMSQSIRTVDTHMEMLSRSVQATTQSISQMADSIRQIAGGSAELSGESETTSTAVQAIDQALKQIRERSDQTLALAERVIQDAGDARSAVERATTSIDQMVATSSASRTAMEALQRHIHEIGEIVRIQKSITSGTKLLALNATIIAARFGEGGRELGEVANDIKELSIKSREKTKDIEGLVHQIHSAGRTAQEADAAGRASIEEGERRSRETAESLLKILDSAALSTESMKGIALSTQEQARQSQQVRHAIQKVAAGVNEISRATGEQRRGSELIQRATNEIRDYAQLVKRTTQDQRAGIDQVVGHIGTIRERIDAIQRSTGDLDRGSQRVVQSIGTIREATRRTDTMIEQMNVRVRALFDQAESLTAEVSRFRLVSEPLGGATTAAPAPDPRMPLGGGNGGAA